MPRPKTFNDEKLDILSQNVVGLHAAKLRYAGRTGDENSTNAYKNDAEVRRYADAIFAEFSTLSKTVLQKEAIRGVQQANAKRIDIDDVESIALMGQPGTENFGGLMGAILKCTPDKAPRQAIEYFKTRMGGEVIDYFRSVLGRAGSPKSAEQVKIYGAGSLQGLQEKRAGEAERLQEVVGTYMGMDASNEFGINDARAFMIALQALEDPHQSIIRQALYEGIESKDGVAKVESWVKRESKGKQGRDIKGAITQLKFAYLQLSDDELPELVVGHKDRLEQLISEPERSAQAVYDFAKSMGITLKVLGHECGLSESRISQMRANSQVPKRVIEVLGLQGRVSPAAIQVLTKKDEPAAVVAGDVTIGNSPIAPERFKTGESGIVIDGYTTDGSWKR
jgi:hypothetical protein